MIRSGSVEKAAFHGVGVRGSERPAVARPPPVMATEAVDAQTAVHPGGEGSCGAAGDHH